MVAQSARYVAKKMMAKKLQTNPIGGKNDEKCMSNDNYSIEFSTDRQKDKETRVMWVT